METASTMGSTPKARLPAGRKASGISAVVKATERAGVCSRLTVKTRRPVESAAVMEAAVLEITVAVAEVAVAVAEITVIESAVMEGSAVRDEAVMGDD